MATEADDDQPQTNSTGDQLPQPAGTDQTPGEHQPAGHGSTGEGSSSAMARLISQEQARLNSGAPDDAPQGSS